MGISKQPIQRKAFTLVEMLVTIGIIAILASIIMPSLRAASQTSHRTQINSQVGQMVQMSDYRIFGKHLGDLIYTTVPPAQHDVVDVLVFQPTPWIPYVEEGHLNNPNNWIAIQSKNESLFKGFSGFNRVHPFNADHGYFIFNANIYSTQALEKKGVRRLRISEERKIAFDVYDYRNEGDGKVSVGFADGHVGVESTQLRGLPDTKGTLILTLAESYTPGTLKNDHAP